jgi:hypothetical protein
MFVLLFCWILGAAAPDTRAHAGPQDGSIPDEVQAIARRVAGLPIGERMRQISEPFLGLPYLLDGIGEAVAPDGDPPSRYDAFDCLSFVEEVLALAFAGDPSGASEVKAQLRYRDGVVKYENRRHFMDLEWVPENIAAGWLEDVTAQYGQTHLVTKTVTATTWKAWKSRKRFFLTDAQLPTGTITIPLLSLDAATQAAERMEPGTLVLTVRKNRDYVPIVVTHLGFVIPPAKPGDVARMRHCTKMGDQRVRDDRLAWYFEHLHDYSKWPVDGIQLLRPVERGPRAGGLNVGREREGE